MKETAEITEAELERLAVLYTPLVKASANRYKGRGAEYDDLVQEGYLALVLLIPKCADRKWLPAFLKSRLPGYVRAAASRLRYGERVGFEVIENAVSGGAYSAERDAAELRDALARLLTPEELDLTQALTEGFTQREIAELAGVSQQAVSLRLKRIRDKLRTLLRAEGENGGGIVNGKGKWKSNCKNKEQA